MTRKPRELTNEERRLWTRVASTAKPRSGKAAPAPLPAVEGASALRPALNRKPPDRRQAKPPAAPSDRSKEKRVRRGKLEIGASLDLHGHTQTSARSALERFVRRAQRNGDRIVLVVTGVGRTGEGVLKRRLPEWLAEPGLRDIVSGFSKAHRTHGGEGAFYLFVRSPR